MMTKPKLTSTKIGGNVLGVNAKYMQQVLDRIEYLWQRDGRLAVVFSVFYTEFNGKSQSLTDVADTVGMKISQGEDADWHALTEPYFRISKEWMNSSNLNSFLKEFKSYAETTEKTIEQCRDNRRYEGYIKARLRGIPGEVSTAAMMDYILRSQGLNSTHIRLERLPIITDNPGKTYENVNFSPKESLERREELINHLKDKKIVCIPGFVGITKGETEWSWPITNFGRGGSDRTNVDIGVLLNDIFDVTVDFEKRQPKGYENRGAVLSADPRYVENPEHVPSLSYDETYFAGQTGMKIVDPAAIGDVKESGYDMLLVVTNIDNPNQTTRIQREPVDGNPIKIVAGRRGCAMLECSFDGKKPIRDKLELELRFKDLAGFSDDEENRRARLLIYDWSAVKGSEPILRLYDPSLNVVQGLGVVAAIGKRMGPSTDIAPTLYGYLQGKGIWIRDFDGQSSTSKIITVVKEEDVEKTVREMHEASKLLIKA